MSAPPGFAASNSTEASRHTKPSATADWQPQRRGYLQQRALRQQAAEIRRLIVYGLTIGWLLTFVAGFLFFCVKSNFDWLWCSALVLGLVHLAASVLLPQALFWPERVWMKIARLQGHAVMTILLTAVYYLLLWPASRFSRKQKTGFYRWTDRPPEIRSSWQQLENTTTYPTSPADNRYRNPLFLFGGIITFFYYRGNYILLPILVLLLILGLVLFLVQSSVIAPFIYPLF